MAGTVVQNIARPDAAAVAGLARAGVATEVRRLYVLLCGYEVLPKTVSTRDLGSRFILAEPVCAYLLDTARGWVLLDTGLDPDYANDPAIRERHFLAKGFAPPVVREAHLLERQLGALGLATSDIAHVILSHLHLDHCARLDRFVHARISVQEREHRVAFGGDEPGEGYLPRDYAVPGLDWDLRHGDWQAMPGLQLIAAYGHTAGHQAAMIRLPSGKSILLPFDAGDLAENFTDEILPGACHDTEAARASLLKLKSLGSAPDTEMLLFHDPVAIQTIRLSPEFYD
jgi:N-acyl homoserine lactone hydrolase